MNRRQPVVEYKQHLPFNGPVIRPSTKTQPQTAAKPVQAAPKAEKAPSTQPKPKLTQEAFWGRYAGHRLTFQVRSGAIITGTVSGLEKNYIRLTECSITGRNNRASTTWTMLDCNSISHFHPGDAEVEAIS
jgi:hypothetical protein